MIFEQHYLGCLSQASYLIADEGSRVAAVVDPRRDVDVYLEAAERHGVEIRHVLLTHVHADFLAGHLELRERCGAALHLGARAEADYEFHPLADGDTLELGPSVSLTALATPGHTPESTCYLVSDAESEAAGPDAVLTGDTLFIGDVGRPDLMASVGVSAGELASMLYRSLREKLLPLPDDTLVYPGHGAGSACGKSLSSDTVSTIGGQRRDNYALQEMSEAAFVEIVTADQPTAPAYFAFTADLNKRERPTLESSLERSLAPLTLDDVLARADAGAQILDTRAADDFAEGHLSGSVSVGLDGRFASWVGTVLDARRSIVLICDAGTEREAATRLGRIGFDAVEGFLAGGVSAVESRPDLLRTLSRVAADDLADQLAGSEPPVVLDVRGPGEYADRHVEQAMHVPLPELSARVGEVPRDAHVVVHCAGGYRSAIAASLLLNAGFERVSDLTGGIAAWTGATASI